MSRLSLAAAVLLAIPGSSLAQQGAAFAVTADPGLASEAIFETKDAAVLTVGLTPLAKSDLRQDDREMRIWYSGFGNPQFLIIIKQSRNSTSGRLMLWWDQYYETSPASADKRVDNFVRAGYDCGPISKRDSRYGEDRWISSVCEAKLKGDPDWQAFLAEVDAHPAQSARAATTTDDQNGSENWGITVERKSGATYGVSHYRTALTFGAPQPGRGPKLQDMINALAATAKRDAAVAQH